ncbi:GNAT family N-acetyltransferase [Rhodococcus sp. RDE2]|nr:GNAT family N-acetyltransferase [Rhodococcus sp. RDE2]BDB63421.1 GCN5 family acetyltransferase [Rhodococcus sp. RDE2]
MPYEPMTLTTADAGQLLTLQRAAYVAEAQAHRDLELPPLTETLDELITELVQPAVTALGIRDDTGRLIAAVRLPRMNHEPHAAELGRLVVAPDQQGRGLGTQLLHHAEMHLQPRVTELRLFTGEHSEANLRLYGGHGYRKTGRTPTPAGYALIHLTKHLN